MRLDTDMGGLIAPIGIMASLLSKVCGLMRLSRICFASAGITCQYCALCPMLNWREEVALRGDKGHTWPTLGQWCRVEFDWRPLYQR
jgi:hypothetical protein